MQFVAMIPPLCRTPKNHAYALLLFAVCTGQALSMGSAPDPNRTTSACLSGEAIQDGADWTRCQWANAETGWNSVRLQIHPERPHSQDLWGQIQSAHFSTRVSLCEDQSDTACTGTTADLFGRFVTNSMTFRFKVGSDTFMEGKIGTHTVGGIRHYGFIACDCR